jgi:hypothetical protein
LKIPLNPPFQKGEGLLLPFAKGGREGFYSSTKYSIKSEDIFGKCYNTLLRKKRGHANNYFAQTYEIINNNHTKYIFAGSLRVAKVDSLSLYYYHKDHLGNSTVITDAN